MLSYEPLWHTMKEKGVTTYTLIEKHGVSSRTIYNLKHGYGIILHTLERLCRILSCEPNDIVKFYADDEME